MCIKCAMMYLSTYCNEQTRQECYIVTGEEVDSITVLYSANKNSKIGEHVAVAFKLEHKDIMFGIFLDLIYRNINLANKLASDAGYQISITKKEESESTSSFVH